jgi:hypothetical protein
MTKDALAERLEELAGGVVADPRWKRESDDFGVSVLGMLLYGFALATGRMVMFLDIEEIDAAVVASLIKTTGAATKWTSGLIAEANSSAFDKNHHPGHHELIGVGHSYFGVKDHAAVVDNIFANIRAFRRA